MHHIVLDRWSRGQSGLHRLDARAKLLAILTLLVAIATASRHVSWVSAAFSAVLLGALAAARIPLPAALLRAALVFAFAAPVALVSFAAGQSERAVSLLLKSYVSSLSVILLVSTTPMPMLLRAVESFGAPRFLLMVAQFLYRYLFVISEEAQHMRKAAVSRGSSAEFARRAGFRAAAGAIGSLFGRSYSRAADIHRAMLARGFSGRLPSLAQARFTGVDAVFVAASVALVVLVRVASERLGR